MKVIAFIVFNVKIVVGCITHNEAYKGVCQYGYKQCVKMVWRNPIGWFKTELIK